MINIIQSNVITPALLLAGVASTNQIQNEYVQYGFLGILLTVLIWYSKRSYSEGIRRDKLAEQEKKDMIARYDALIKEKDAHHERELKEERDRYHDVHKEIMLIMRSNLKIIHADE